MITDFLCPICNSQQWEIVETYCYDKQNLVKTHSNMTERRLYKLRKLARTFFYPRPETKPISFRYLNSFQRSRQDVLFNIWFPGQDKIRIKSQYCCNCGFGCYTPRPTDQDIKAKYASFCREQTRKKKPKITFPSLRKDIARAKRIFSLTTRNLSQKKLSVLDYGGGDGRILLPFIDTKHDCYLVDYSEKQLPNVHKIADDLDSMRSDLQHDIIICSHVLEHLSDPVGLLKGMKKHFHKDGLMYAEVPMEIRSGFAIEADPVTHNNFFTPASFQNLFAKAGYKLISFQKKISNYEQHKGVMMWVIAQPIESDKSNRSQTLLPPDIKTYLFPSRLMSIYLYLRLRLCVKIRDKIKSIFTSINPIKKQSQSQ